MLHQPDSPEPHTTDADPQKLPPDAVDVHSHILIQGRSRIAQARYQPFDAPLSAYEDHLSELGARRGVIVTASTYGTDNTILLDALHNSRLPLRGIAVIDPDDITDPQLESMHQAGIRGLRLQDRFPGGARLDRLEDLGAKVAHLGWHLELWTDFSQHLQWLPAALRRCPVPVVIDHLGYYYGDTPQHRAATRALIDLAGEGHIWVTLSGAYRIVPDYRADFDDPWLSRHVENLALHASTRLIWGSDWPHVAPPCPPPSTPALVAETTRWLRDDPALVHQVLVTNPNECYGFPPTQA